MKYIDAEKLIAEIERYKQGAAIARFDNAGENADYFQGKVDLCDDLTHIITSLQQEQQEVDLEKLGGIARHLIAVKYHEEDMRLDDGEWLLIERIGYPERFSARKEE